MSAQGKQESGAVLITVVVIMVFLGGVITLATGRSVTLAADSVQAVGERMAFEAASAGLARARHNLKKAQVVGESKSHLGGSDILVRVRREEAGQWTIESHACSYPRGRRGLPVRKILRAGFGLRTWYAEGPARGD